MGVIKGVAYTPLFMLSSIPCCRCVPIRADEFVLHPTPEGPFHERSFSCMMQLYTAQRFVAQPVFPLCESDTFPVVVASVRGKNFRGKSGFPLAGQRCINIRFHSASASTSLGTTLIADHVDF